MNTQPMVISLPTDDRRRAFDFYVAAFDLTAIGEPADDGVPEPLQFEVRPGVTLMLIPRDGFGWVLNGQAVAEPGTNECILSFSVEGDDEVDRVLGQAKWAGATVIADAGPQPWGYVGTFADPDGHVWMITSAQT